MKYLLLAYQDKQAWESMSSSERAAFEMDCSANEELLQQSGQLLVVESVQSSTATVQILEGEVCVTDSTLDETKQQLRAFYVIDARDLNKAIYVASKMPQARNGPIEVRALATP